MNILIPYPQAPGQLKFLIMAIDYFTKWIEEETLGKITTKNILKNFKRNILARYKILQAVIIENGT